MQKIIGALIIAIPLLLIYDFAHGAKVLKSRAEMDFYSGMCISPEGCTCRTVAGDDGVDHEVCPRRCTVTEIFGFMFMSCSW